MDIAILAAARFPIREPFAGGMEMHTHVLADALHHRGHDVTVYAADGAGPYGVRPMLALDFEPSPAARRDVSSGPGPALAEHHSYLDAMLHLAGAGHQIVHINAVHHLPFACAGMLRSSVVTATLHTPPTPWLESALTLGRRTGAVPSMVSVSKANARAWSPLPLDGVIHNGVDLTRWQPGPGGDAAVWWGRLVPEKAPHLAIDAARRAGVDIRLAGPRHDDAYFDTEIAPRLGSGVEYVGHLGLAETAALVRTSAVAVVTPTWDEPFGLVVAEALACGTPVAAFARGALIELLDEDTGRLAPAGDVGALVDAIRQAGTLDRGDCRRRAEQRFSASTMTDGYESWFRTLLRSRQAA
jgi:glycosyltransferase involved in cell wall biosynthesis